MPRHSLRRCLGTAASRRRRCRRTDPTRRRLSALASLVAGMAANAVTPYELAVLVHAYLQQGGYSKTAASFKR